jgi:hypothetical protein
MTHPYLDEVIGQLTDWDAARPRSQQTTVGWSGMADCRSMIGFMIAEEWATDDTDTWRAIAGTALHDFLTEVRSTAVPSDMNVEFGVSVEYGGIPGTADEVSSTRSGYRPEGAQLIVTDWKFPSLAATRIWGDPEVLDERFVQPQGYAAGVLKLPRWSHVKPKDVKVQILVAPVDGTFPDWRLFERPFDRAVADDAIARYQDVIEDVKAGEQLPRDKPWHFCETYCEYFTLCRGEQRPRELPEITDAETAAAIEAYGIANEQESAAAKIKKELGPLVRGVRGHARGWTSTMTRPGTGAMGLDEARIEQEYNARNWEVPYVAKPGRPPSLRITRDKRDPK